jgi:hypothetical protein
VIRDHITASTAGAAQGDALTKAELEQLFQQMPDPMPAHQHHDRGLPVVGRMYNKRLVEVEPNVWGIVVDVDLDDNVDLSVLKGSSVAFADKTFGPDAIKRSDVEILLDSQHFTVDEIKAAVGIGPNGELVGTQRLRRFGLSTAGIVVIVVVTFITKSTCDGFFKEIGKDFYQFLKSKLKSLGEQLATKGKTIAYEFAFEVSEDGHTYEVVVRADENAFQIFEAGVFSIDDLRRQLAAYQDPSKVSKVFARLASKPPYLRTERTIPRE